ncbi:hypothetical protein D3C80_1723250 [compost metagenome]
MFDQYEAGGERRAFDQRDFTGVFADRVFVIDTVGNHLAIGDAAHAGLIEGTGGTLVEMHAAMPQTVRTHRVETAPGLGQAG